MSHLSLEELARLVDEAPGPGEAAHLRGCSRCEEELRALKDQTGALRGLPPLDPPARAWAGVEARLRREGILRTGPGRRRLGAPLMRLAAALTLLLTGGAAGWAAAHATGSAGPGSGLAAGGEDVAAPSTVEDAASQVLAAESDYLEALSRYNRLTGSQEPQDVVARLAALQSIVLTTRAALNEAPADPVINGYHFTALAQRDAMLRQIAATQEEPWF